jgi:hypothetical protein
MRPKAFASQRATQITTTTLRIDLMDAAMGMKRFTIHRRIPTTIRTPRSWSNGMIVNLPVELLLQPNRVLLNCHDAHVG